MLTQRSGIYMKKQQYMCKWSPIGQDCTQIHFINIRTPTKIPLEDRKCQACKKNGIGLHVLDDALYILIEYEQLTLQQEFFLVN